jgi:hypothetical protein
MSVDGGYPGERSIGDGRADERLQARQSRCTTTQCRDRGFYERVLLTAKTMRRETLFSAGGCEGGRPVATTTPTTEQTG